MTRPIPVATYRIQLTPDFGFGDVIGILDHLVSLGISHVYLSPIGAAMPGSTHGYDWVPAPRVAEALGGIDGLRALRKAATAAGLGLIIDIVPNHTGVADALANPWFADLLTHGTGSRYADFFDVDFSVDNGSNGKIALPVLAADGDLSPLRVAADRLHYHDHRFPIAPGTLGGTPTDVHARQHYRLVPWNSGLIGYRRFFTVNELAGLRQEDRRVFDATHVWIADLLSEDLIDGVRVDHPDGLWDAMGYLHDLRTVIGEDRLLYVEKILGADEALDPSLPVEGTTGYDQLRIVDGVFTASSGVIELGEMHETFTGEPGDAAWLTAEEHNRKLVTLAEQFPTEHRRLVTAISHADPDVDRVDIADATAEIIAALGVYRADYPSLRTRLTDTIARIRERRPDLAAALDLILRATATTGAASARLAQTCGAVTAKSVEDSLFYRTARLVSAQEVGGDPANPALELRDFHEHNLIRARDWPLAMTAASTHDTKRGEDVRARIALLTQVPERWGMLVRDLWRIAPPPDALTGYFLLQNIIGVWPLDVDAAAALTVDDTLRERLHAYAQKATREAGLHTTWTEVDDGFESAVNAWIDEITAGVPAEKIRALLGDLAPAWRQEVCARKVIDILGPGVADIYQGTEWFDDSLVDPDNRRPVDFGRSLDHPKVAAVRAATAVRRRHADSFGATGTYTPLRADGPAADHVVAFARGTADGEPQVLVVTARFTQSLDEKGTALVLPPGTWHDTAADVTFSGTVDLADLRAYAPVAILERVG